MLVLSSISSAFSNSITLVYEQANRVGPGQLHGDDTRYWINYYLKKAACKNL